MTNEIKAEVARMLIIHAGDLVEFWGDRFASVGEEPPCTAAEAAELIGRWLRRLPGDYWDTRLGEG